MTAHLGWGMAARSTAHPPFAEMAGAGVTAGRAKGSQAWNKEVGPNLKRSSGAGRAFVLPMRREHHADSLNHPPTLVTTSIPWSLTWSYSLSSKSLLGTQHYQVDTNSSAWCCASPAEHPRASLSPPQVTEILAFFLIWPQFELHTGSQ